MRNRKRWLVVPVGIVALATALTTSRATAAPTPPNPVLAVTLSTPDQNTTLKATWVPSPVGTPAEWYVAQAFSGSTFWGQAWCFETDCTSVSIPGLPANKLYAVNVYPANFGGYGGPRTSAPYFVTSGCTDGGDLCTTVTVSSTNGAAALRGQGFQNGQPLSATERATLQPRFWRIGVNPFDYTLFDSARAGGAKILAILSDGWYGATVDPATMRARAPWADWNAYRTWVRGYATTLINSGHNPDYWDVQNEPGLPNYLTAADTAQWTPARMLEQFKAAYEEIRAVDPNAKVIGPSVAAYSDVARPMVLDVKTFLNYVQANGIQLGAVTWHEVSARDMDGDTTALPVEIAYNVATARKLMAQRGLGNPEVLISEYGAQQMHLIPGWTVGYLSTFEASNVDGANHTCWTSEPAPTFNECTNSSTGGMFTADGTQRLANYWVHQFYASMTGTRVASHTSTATMSTFAVADPSGVVRVLLGRHEQCTPALPFGCALGLMTPVTKNISLDVDASPLVTQWQVTVNRIPATTSPLAAPVAMLDTTVIAVAGRVHVPLTAVNDGEAVTITLTPIA